MSQQKKLNAFTVDLEEWYQGIEIPIAKTFEDNNKPKTIIAIAFLMIPKSYTKLSSESVHEFLH